MEIIHEFRLFKASWGIVIDIYAELAPYEQDTQTIYSHSIKPIDYKDSFLALFVEDKIYEDSVVSMFSGYKIMGIELASEHLYRLLNKQDHPPRSYCDLKPSCYNLKPMVIRIFEIDYNPCDYQEEGLAPAIAAWLAKACDFAPPPVNAYFSKAENRYYFEPEPDVQLRNSPASVVS